MALLTVSGISKKLGSAWALHPSGFELEEGGRIAIAGETGSGKTTLLRIIGGLEQPDQGEVTFEGTRVLGPLEKLIPGHPGIVYLSQFFELRNHYRVEEELESKNQLTEREAATLYDVCRITPLLRRWTHELSGGEKQRIALARLLGTRPRLLLLDEPFSNLDGIHKQVMKDVIRDVGEKLGIACILVSHDAPDILSWADRIIVMGSGNIIQHADPITIYRNPVNEYCAALFGEYNLIDAAAFGIAPERTPRGRLLARPEHIRLSKATGAAGVPGTITGCDFRGSHFIYTVNATGDALRVFSLERLFQEGDSVQLELSLPDYYWL